MGDRDEAWLGWLKALAIAAVIAGGLAGGLGIADLIAPVAVLVIGFAVDDLMQARRLSSVDAGADDDSKSPRDWFLLALGYLAAAVVVGVAAWWYLA